MEVDRAALLELGDLAVGQEQLIGQVALGESGAGGELAAKPSGEALPQLPGVVVEEDGSRVVVRGRVQGRTEGGVVVLVVDAAAAGRWRSGRRGARPSRLRIALRSQGSCACVSGSRHLRLCRPVSTAELASRPASRSDPVGRSGDVTPSPPSAEQASRREAPCATLAEAGRTPSPATPVAAVRHSGGHARPGASLG